MFITHVSNICIFYVYIIYIYIYSYMCIYIYREREICYLHISTLTPWITMFAGEYPHLGLRNFKDLQNPTPGHWVPPSTAILEPLQLRCHASTSQSHKARSEKSIFKENLAVLRFHGFQSCSLDFPWLFPTCLVRVSKPLLLFSSSPPRPQPRAPDLSGHCRASTASSRAQWALPDQPRVSEPQQWALPDFNRDRQISVGTARPQPRAPDL